MVLWEDREVRFDIDTNEIKERPGEMTLAYFDPVEDTKGNNGIRGFVRITNLRVVWETKKHQNLNLSVGLKTVVNCSVKQVNSKLRGNIEALHLLAKGVSSRFEFIFSCVQAKKGPSADNQQRDLRLVDVLNRILSSYRNSSMFRQLHLRVQIFNRKELQLLSDERIYSEISGVWNLSAEQGNLGKFIFTSVRIIWFAESNLLFNVSLPWVQVENIKIRDSKFGTALVLISSPSSTKYTLGFRIDPEEKLREVGKEAAQLYKAHGKQPDFGVRESRLEDSISYVTEFDEDVDLLQAESKCDPALLYATHAESAEPVFDETIGLAVEQLPEGVTLQNLWNFR